MLCSVTLVLKCKHFRTCKIKNKHENEEEEGELAFNKKGGMGYKKA